jgi:hypothetical protein
MFNLYVGYKYKHIQLYDGYILNAVLTGEIDGPLTLSIDIDIAELYRTGSEELVKYLIAYNTVLYLENKDLNFGYKFTKKHNQSNKFILLGKDGEEYLKIDGNEFFEDRNFSIDNEDVNTINGPSKLIKNSNSNIDPEANLYETVIYTDVKSSQSMVNRLNSEELSISSQILENDVLKITLFSSMLDLNFTKNQGTYGVKYKGMLSTILPQFFPDTVFDIQNDIEISYPLELKQNIEIMKDLTKSRNMIDGGYDLLTKKSKITIYDPKIYPVTFRATTVNNNYDNPHILSMKENYPTLSVNVVNNRKYIREGSKGLFDYSNIHTRYRGQYIVEKFSIDLLYNFQQDSSTIIISKTGKDVRKNYLEQNLNVLSNRLL